MIEHTNKEIKIIMSIATIKSCTHTLDCIQMIWGSLSSYTMKCIPLKTLKSGLVKVLVFKTWKNKYVRSVHESKINLIEL